MLSHHIIDDNDIETRIMRIFSLIPMDSVMIDMVFPRCRLVEDDVV